MDEKRSPSPVHEHERRDSITRLETRSECSWQRGPFDHERLDAYRIIPQAVVVGEAIAQKLPRGFGELKDQLRRALCASHLRFAEAVYRTGKDRLMRYRCARGEAAEAAAALDLITILGLVPEHETEPVIALLGRFCAMLTRLAQLGRS